MSILNDKNIDFTKIKPILIYVDHAKGNNSLSTQNNFINSENNEIQN